jgi:hypothetical protein
MNLLSDRKKVYFVNVDAMSGQSDNGISMSEILKYLSEQYPEFIFFVTNKINLSSDNIVYIEDLTRGTENLNELSFTSTYCDILIGRYSGPHSFSYIKDNFYKNKLFLSFITPTVNNDIDFGLKNVDTGFKFTNSTDINKIKEFLSNLPQD